MRARALTIVVAAAAISLAFAGVALAYTQFQMPSHKIVCGEVKGDAFTPGPYLRCDMLFLNDRAVLLTTKGRAKLVHVTDAIANPNTARVLPYGTTRHFGPFVCTSKTTGLYCRHGGHGFAISRQFQQVY